ncbi:hypothetical protein Dsin_010105 [Dipteronia sinensis]|uniref:Uncharacterized protein n=1 Tax=Dipteronia sinensis TaxID=43782 RepID=A0AAE0AST5_9ROSI|nr:hypothetical protein Dsin_010105 [Dipteronia sinensis]
MKQSHFFHFRGCLRDWTAVNDYQARQSFISNFTAKAQTMFSLKFSSLTIMKQNLAGSYSGKARGGHVNKIVEIKDLEICCSTFQSDVKLLSLDNVDSKFWSNKFNHLLKPFNVSVSLMINRSGKLDDDFHSI